MDESLYEILHPFFTKAYGMRWIWYLMHLVCDALHTFTTVCRPVEWVAPFKCHIHNTRTAHAIPALHGGNFCEKIFRSRGTLKIHTQNTHIHWSRYCALPGNNSAFIVSHTFYKRNSSTELTLWNEMLSVDTDDRVWQLNLISLMTSEQEKQENAFGARPRVDLDNFEVG